MKHMVDNFNANIGYLILNDYQNKFKGGYRGYKIENTVTISKNSRISQNELRSHLFNNFYSTIFIAHISRICIYYVILDNEFQFAISSKILA